MDNTTRITDLEVPLNSQPKSSSPLAGKSRTNKRVSIQFDPNRSIIAAGVSERLLNQPGLENVKLYIEEVKSAYDNAAIQNKEALEKLDMLKKNFCEVKNAYEKENLQLKNSIRMSDCSRVELTQEIKLLKRHLSIKDQCDSEVKQKLDETLELYDKLKEEMEVIEEENSRLKDTVVLLDSYDMKIKEYVDMVSILVQDKEILELRLVGLQKELQKQVQMNYSSKDMEVDVYLCKAKLRQVEKKYNNILRNLDDTNTEKESLENNVKQLRDTIYALEIDLKFFQDQVIDQVKEIEKQRSQLKKFELENKDLNIIINDLKEELTGRERAYLIKESVLQEKLSAITTENKGYIEQIAQEYQNEKEKLLQRHKEQIELLNKKHKETIAENYKKEEIKINAMKKQFNEQLDIVAIAATSRSEDKIKELKNQVKEHEITIHNLKNENRGILEEKHIIESELKDAEEIYTQTLQGKISECSELSKTLSHTKDELNKYDLCMRKLEKDNADYKTRIETIFEPKIDSLTEQNRKLEEQFIEKYTFCNNLQIQLEEKRREIEILKVQKNNTFQQGSQNIEVQGVSPTTNQLLHELSEYKRYALELQESYNSLKANFDNQLQIINDGKLYTDFITKKLEEKDLIIRDLEEKIKEIDIINKNIVDTELVQKQTSINNCHKMENKNILFCRNCEKLAKDISTLDHKAQDLISQINFMQTQINGLNIQANSYSDKIEQLEQQIEVYEDERLEYETKENDMKERIKKLECDNKIISKEINCLKEQLCKVNQELIIKDQELSRHHEQLLKLEIEKEKLKREKFEQHLNDGKSDGDTMISKEVYETILSDSEMLINDLREFVDRISVTLESLMNRPFPTLPEIDYPSMINIAKAVVQLIELIPSKEINDNTITNAISPHIDELNNKIRHLEDRLCENNRNWESFYKIEHDCRMSFEEKLKAAEEQINRLTMQLLEEKGIEEIQKTVAESAMTIIPPELLSSVPIGIKMKISILAAKLSTKMLDNDALLRANKEIADTNVLLQNRVDYYKEKLESIEDSYKNNLLQNTFVSSGIENCESVENEAFKNSNDLIEDTFDSQGDVPMISNTESLSSTGSIADICSNNEKKNVITDDENEEFCNKSNMDSVSLQNNDEEVYYAVAFEKVNDIMVETSINNIDMCLEKNVLSISTVDIIFLKEDEKSDNSITFDLKIEENNMMTLEVPVSPVKSFSIEEKDENVTGDKGTDGSKLFNQISKDIKPTEEIKKIKSIDNQDFSNNTKTDMDDKEKLKNKMFNSEKNLDDNNTYHNPVSKKYETMAIESKKSRSKINDQVTLTSKGGRIKEVTNKIPIVKKVVANTMEVFDPFEIPKLPQRDDDNIFDEILAQDSKVDLPTITAKKKSILNVEKKKTIKKTLIGNDIFTNFNLPDIITTTISTVPKGNKVNLSSSNSKGAFVAPDKVLLNREYSVPKQSSDVLLHHRSETPKDFVPVDFKKEPPKSILKPRALSKPKYSN